MSEISETEIKAMTKEQNYMHGYADGKTDVLDKIRVEIEQEYLAEGHSSDYWSGIDKCLQIIDKYKAEREE